MCLVYFSRLGEMTLASFCITHAYIAQTHPPQHKQLNYRLQFRCFQAVLAITNLASTAITFMKDKAMMGICERSLDKTVNNRRDEGMTDGGGCLHRPAEYCFW